MTDDKVKDLEERLEKLEKSNKGAMHFFIQYVISPLMVLVMGFAFNYQLQQQRSQIQKIEIAHNMLETLFSEDYSKSLATARLLDKLLDDRLLVKEINDILKDLMNSKVTAAMAARDYDTVYKIYTASEDVWGGNRSIIAASLISNTEISKKVEEYKTGIELSSQLIDAIDKEEYDQLNELTDKLKAVSPELYNDLRLSDITAEELQKESVTRDMRERLSNSLPSRQITVPGSY